MSIIVMGMDMPTSCRECIERRLGFRAYFGCIKGTVAPSREERLPDCPLRPLPEKHGDLVDISQEVNIEYFDDMNQEWSLKAGTVAEALSVCEEFPETIVEAEGE